MRSITATAAIVLVLLSAWLVGAQPAAPGASDGAAASASAPAPTSSAPVAPAPAASSSAAPPPATSAGPAAPPAAMDGSTYAVRLRDIAQRVDDLKEQVRRSQTRLSLLSDSVMSGSGGGASTTVRVLNELSSTFRLTQVLVVLDGAVQLNRQDEDGELAKQKEIPVYDGSIAPGDHTLQVLVRLRGHGFGVFSYLRAYKFEVRSTHAFTVTEGKHASVDAVVWEQGGVTTAIEERPAVRYDVRVTAHRADDVVGDTAAPAPAAASAAAGVSVGTDAKKEKGAR